MANNLPYDGVSGPGVQNYDPTGQLARAMTAGGIDTSPIRSKWQGAARLSQALMGGLLAMQQRGQYNAAPPTGAITPGSGGAAAPSASPGASPLANPPPPPPPAGTYSPSPLGSPGSSTPTGGPMSMDTPTSGPFITPGSGKPIDFPTSSSSGTAAVNGGGFGAMPTAGSFAGGQAAPSDQLSLLKGFISGQESGSANGDYHAIGKPNPNGNGDVALGKYQVMKSNVPSWTQQALGQSLTPEQFLASPVAQEAVADKILGGYLNKYGPQGAARAWLGGEGSINQPGRRDWNGTSVGQYGAGANAAVAGAPPSPEAGQSANPDVIAALQRQFGANGFNGPGPVQGDANSQASLPTQGAQAVSMMMTPQAQAQLNPSAAANLGANYQGMTNNALPSASPGFQQPPSQAGAQAASSGSVASSGFNNPFQALMDQIKGLTGGGGGNASPAGAPPAPSNMASATALAPQGQNQPAASPAPANPNQDLISRYNTNQQWLASNPYANPQTREMVMNQMNMIQQILMKPQTWMDTPGGGKQAMDPFGHTVPGQNMPAAPEWKVIGKDLLGNEKYGWVNPATGQVVPLANGGAPQPQPPAPSAQPAPGQSPAPQPLAPTNNGAPAPATPSAPAPGGPPQYPNQKDFDTSLNAQQQKWQAQLSAQYGADSAAQVAQLARNYVNGSQGLPNGNAQAKPLEQVAWNLATQFDPTLTQRRYSTVSSFTPGSGGNDDKTILAGRTALAHSGEARAQSDQLSAGQSNLPVIGPIMNWASNTFQHQGDAAAYEAAARTAFNEVNKAYVGGPGSQDERELPAELKASANPEVRTRYWAMLGHQLQDKINKMQEGYHNGAGNVPDFPLLNNDDQTNLVRMEDLGQYGPKGGQSGPAELTEEQYNVAPSGTHYRLPGSTHVMVKP